MGSRVQLLGRSIRRRAARHYIGRVMATITAASMGVAVYDTQCGAKLFRAGPGTRALFEEPFMSRWLFDVELIMRILVAQPHTEPGTLVREVPLAEWTEVPGSRVSMTDGFRALADLQRIRRRYGRRGSVL
jgi:dolichyl-phosphate beta-glucosyltransferase